MRNFIVFSLVTFLWANSSVSMDVDRTNINEGESITLNLNMKNIDIDPDIILPDIPNFDPEWNEKYFMRKNLLPDIYRHFDEYGVEYFKDLNVWHIPQLRDRLNDKN